MHFASGVTEEEDFTFILSLGEANKLLKVYQTGREVFDYITSFIS